MSARSRSFALALTLPLFAACENAAVTGPGTMEQDALETVLSSAALTGAAAGERGTGGSLFDQLAAEIPEFGGLFRAGRCTVGLVLTSLEHDERAVAIVQAALERLLGEACPEGVRVIAQRGEFTYVQLIRWLHAARPLHEIRGVLGVGIDYSVNRLVVTVASRAVAAQVLEALPRLDIPAGAVKFKAGSSGSRG
jgi:hypothetical protein